MSGPVFFLAIVRASPWLSAPIWFYHCFNALLFDRLVNLLLSGQIVLVK